MTTNTIQNKDTQVEGKNEEAVFIRKTKIVKSNASKSIRALHDEWIQGKLNFTLAIQRGEVWNHEQKTDLIFSILYGYYIPEIVAEARVGDPNLYFLDGKQRITTIMNFIDGNWALSKNMKEVYGQNFAKHKFKDLPINVQNAIFDEMISIARLEAITDKERDTQFVFLNAGSSLTAFEKTRAMHSDMIEEINTLATHEFFENYMNLTKDAKKRFVDQEAIMQIAMLLEKGKDGIKGFGSPQIRQYVLELKEKGETLPKEVNDKLNDGLTFMANSANSLDESQQKQAFKKVHVPMIFMSALKAKESELSYEEFALFIKDFLIDNYSTESAYGASSQSSTPKKENVLIRLSEMDKALTKYIAKVKSPKATTTDKATSTATGTGTGTGTARPRRTTGARANASAKPRATGSKKTDSDK